MKLIKFLLKAIVALILIVVIVAVAIPLLIDPNDFKQQIEEQVKLQTGRDIKINGDMDVSLSLPISLRFQLGETELSHPPGFINKANNPFLKVSQVALQASILPLIQENRLEVGKIILKNAHIYLIKNKKGQTNWENFSAAKQPTTTTTKTPIATQQKTSTAGEDSDFIMPEIHIEGVEVSNSVLIYEDLAKQQQLQLNNVNLTISELKENKPIDLDFNLAFKLINKDKDSNLEGQISLKTQAKINLQAQLFQLNKSTLELSVAGKQIPGGKNTTQLTANIILDLAKQLLTIDQLNMNTYQLNIGGKFNVAQLMSEPQFNGDLAVAKFSPKQLMKALALEPPKMKNPKVLNSAHVKLQLSGNTKQLKLTNLDASLDDIIFKGNAAILNLNNPFYKLKLSINKLHLDDYAMAGSAAKSAKKPITAKQPKAAKLPPVALIPVDLIKSLNVDGQLNIGELTSNGIKMTNIILSLKGKGGVVTLDPVQSDFYKGKLKLKTTIDVRKKIPKLTLQQNFTQIDIGQLLLDATATQEFTGTANISSNISTYGNFQDELIKNSNGKGKFLITDGNIPKLEIIHNVRQAYALIHGVQEPTQKQKDNSSFTELKGSVNIKNGVVHNKDLFSKSPVLELTGAGYADLPKQYLDYSLKVKLLNSLKIDKKSNSTDFRSKEFPYTIKGKFSELSQKANIKDIVKQQVKAEANKQINKQLEKQLKGDKGKKIEEKIGKENMKALQSLFKF